MIQENSIKVLFLDLQELEPVHTQHARPYYAVVNHENLNQLQRSIMDTDTGSGISEISPQLTAAVTQGIITVSASHEGAMEIPNGWASKRFRFTLAVQSTDAFGITTITYFQGYSEYFDISHGNHIDPGLVFFINSYTEVRRSMQPNGQYVDTVIGAKQILDGRYVNSQTPENHLWGARPEDLFSGLASSFIFGSSIGGFGNAIGENTKPLLDNKTFATSRQHHIPSAMLSKVVSSYRQAQAMAEMGQGGENVYDRAMSLAYTTNGWSNDFLRRLGGVQGGYEAPSTFTLGQLSLIDPTMPSPNYSPLENPVDYRDYSSETTGSNIEVQLATLLSYSVSSLMQSCGLSTMYFTATNMTLDGSYSVVQTGPGVCIGTANPVASWELFLFRFKNEVMPDITSGNKIPVSISVGSDIFTQTSITISVAGGPAEPFVFPAYCDALMQPTVTHTQNNFNGLVDGLGQILEYTSIENTVSNNNLIQSYLPQAI